MNEGKEEKVDRYFEDRPLLVAAIQAKFGAVLNALVKGDNGEYLSQMVKLWEWLEKGSSFLKHASGLSHLSDVIREELEIVAVGLDTEKLVEIARELVNTDKTISDVIREMDIDRLQQVRIKPRIAREQLRRELSFGYDSAASMWKYMSTSDWLAGSGR